MAKTPKIYGGVATAAAKLTSRLPMIIADLDETTLEGVMEVAERIVEGAKERVPVDDGDLRDAIHIETGTDLVKVTEAKNEWNVKAVYTAQELGEGAIAVVAGNSDIFYGHIVENGGVHTSPRPFLVPAFEVERQSLEDVVGEHIREEIQ